MEASHERNQRMKHTQRRSVQRAARACSPDEAGDVTDTSSSHGSPEQAGRRPSLPHGRRGRPRRRKCPSAAALDTAASKSRTRAASLADVPNSSAPPALAAHPALDIPQRGVSRGWQVHESHESQQPAIGHHLHAPRPHRESTTAYDSALIDEPCSSCSVPLSRMLINHTSSASVTSRLRSPPLPAPAHDAATESPTTTAQRDMRSFTRRKRSSITSEVLIGLDNSHPYGYANNHGEEQALRYRQGSITLSIKSQSDKSSRRFPDLRRLDADCREAKTSSPSPLVDAHTVGQDTKHPYAVATPIREHHGPTPNSPCSRGDADGVPFRSMDHQFGALKTQHPNLAHWNGKTESDEDSHNAIKPTMFHSAANEPVCLPSPSSHGWSASSPVGLVRTGTRQSNISTATSGSEKQRKMGFWGTTANGVGGGRRRPMPATRAHTVDVAMHQQTPPIASSGRDYNRNKKELKSLKATSLGALRSFGIHRSATAPQSSGFWLRTEPQAVHDLPLPIYQTSLAAAALPNMSRLKTVDQAGEHYSNRLPNHDSKDLRGVIQQRRSSLCQPIVQSDFQLASSEGQSEQHFHRRPSPTSRSRGSHSAARSSSEPIGIATLDHHHNENGNGDTKHSRHRSSTSISSSMIVLEEEPMLPRRLRGVERCSTSNQVERRDVPPNSLSQETVTLSPRDISPNPKRLTTDSQITIHRRPYSAEGHRRLRSPRSCTRLRNSVDRRISALSGTSSKRNSMEQSKRGSVGLSSVYHKRISQDVSNSKRDSRISSEEDVWQDAEEGWEDVVEDEEVVRDLEDDESRDASSGQEDPEGRTGSMSSYDEDDLNALEDIRKLTLNSPFLTSKLSGPLARHAPHDLGLLSVTSVSPLLQSDEPRISFNHRCIEEIEGDDAHSILSTPIANQNAVSPATLDGAISEGDEDETEETKASLDMAKRIQLSTSRPRLTSTSGKPIAFSIDVSNPGTPSFSALSSPVIASSTPTTTTSSISSQHSRSTNDAIIVATAASNDIADSPYLMHVSETRRRPLQSHSGSRSARSATLPSSPLAMENRSSAFKLLRKRKASERSSKSGDSVMIEGSDPGSPVPPLPQLIGRPPPMRPSTLSIDTSSKPASLISREGSDDVDDERQRAEANRWQPVSSDQYHHATNRVKNKNKRSNGSGGRGGFQPTVTVNKRWTPDLVEVSDVALPQSTEFKTIRRTLNQPLLSDALQDDSDDQEQLQASGRDGEEGENAMYGLGIHRRNDSAAFGVETTDSGMSIGSSRSHGTDNMTPFLPNESSNGFASTSSLPRLRSPESQNSIGLSSSGVTGTSLNLSNPNHKGLTLDLTPHSPQVTSSPLGSGRLAALVPSRDYLVAGSPSSQQSSFSSMTGSSVTGLASTPSNFNLYGTASTGGLSGKFRSIGLKLRSSQSSSLYQKGVGHEDASLFLNGNVADGSEVIQDILRRSTSDDYHASLDSSREGSSRKGNGGQPNVTSPTCPSPKPRGQSTTPSYVNGNRHNELSNSKSLEHLSSSNQVHEDMDSEVLRLEILMENHQKMEREKIGELSRRKL